MGLEDLALLVGEHRGKRSVQDRGSPSRQRGPVPAVEPVAPGLDADQLHALVVEEGVEGPDRVRAPADAGDHPGGKCCLGRQRLLSRLVADHPLQVPHQRRIRSRPDHRADDVVGRSHVGHPVPDRRADGLLERPRAGLDGDDLGIEQAHALDVRRLAPNVLGAHVDDALEAEQRACRCGRDAVLTRAGLRDHARLSHPAGEQRLADCVVDLVGAGMGEVLPLQVDRAADPLRETVGAIERRRPPHVVA